jgi:hypothetical protein
MKNPIDLDELYRAHTGDAEAFVHMVMEAFGLSHTMDVIPGEEKDRGVFFNYKQGKLEKAEAGALAKTKYIFFTGIDTSGQKYLRNYCGNMAGTLIPKNKVFVTYHYNTTPKERAADFAKIYNEEGYFSEEARIVAQAIFDEKLKAGANEDTVFIGHSFGGIFQEMVLNALAHINLNHEDIGQFSSISFGVKPPWKNGSVESPMLQNVNKLFIVALDDMFHYTPPKGLEGNRQGLAKFNPLENAPSDYHLFKYEGRPLNHLYALLSPGATPSILETDRPNMGGHGLSHYLEALGFVVPQLHMGRIGILNKLHHIVCELVDEPKAFKESLFLEGDHAVIAHSSYQSFDTGKEVTLAHWRKKIAIEEGHREAKKGRDEQKRSTKEGGGHSLK